MDGYMVFDTEVGAVRTDEEFEQMKYLGSDEDNRRRHQIGQSPLIGNFNCVSGFVLDYMHLVLLGVVKRLIEFWKKGSPNDIRSRCRKISETKLTKLCIVSEIFFLLNFQDSPGQLKLQTAGRLPNVDSFCCIQGQ